MIIPDRLIVLRRDAVWEETVLVSGCLVILCSAPPTRGMEMGQDVSRLLGGLQRFSLPVGLYRSKGLDSSVSMIFSVVLVS